MSRRKAAGFPKNEVFWEEDEPPEKAEPSRKARREAKRASEDEVKIDFFAPKFQPKTVETPVVNPKTDTGNLKLFLKCDNPAKPRGYRVL